MTRRLPWRVRVQRNVESWVDVEAMTAVEAEAEAKNVSGVTNVFPKSAIRTDVFTEPKPSQGVEE